MSRLDDRANQVDGPTAQPLSLSDLPPPNTNRWVIRRKAQLVAAVRGGLISLEEVCERYQLSVEEFQTWQESLDQHGVRGLRTTRLQFYRKTPARNEHGAGAALEAAQRADAMLERGDMDGCAVWKRIVSAVEEIERTKRRQDEMAH